MTTTEIDLQITELKAVQTSPGYVACQINALTAVRSRLVETLELDPDGVLFIRTVDPLDDDAEDTRRLGHIEDVSARKIPEGLWDEYDRLEAEWDAAGEQSDRDAAGHEADFRAAKGF